MTHAGPDRRPIDAAALTAAVAGPGRLWNEVRVVATTGSTNSDVADAARAGTPEGLVITTDHQVAGRGRLDRSWQTVPGAALAVSVLLRPRVPSAAWVWLPILTGLAVDAMARDLGVDSALKWPNDVLVDDRKIAGILLERVEGPLGAAAVLGVGLNVTLDRAELPVATATSLMLEGATETDRTAVLTVLLAHVERLYAQWSAADGDPAAGLRAEYLGRCSTVGRRVRVELPDGTDLIGEAETIDEHGRLVVAGHAVSAGDVTHVRPV